MGATNTKVENENAQKLKEQDSVFNTLKKVPVDYKTSDISGKNLSYLTWAKAWEEIKSRYPDASYDVKKFGENELPFQFIPGMGYMVYTSVTIKGETIEMFRPVLNKSNQAMLDVNYEIVYKGGGKSIVNKATMADINNTIMRCLVKNIAMFGLGLHLYAGEDLPFVDDEEKTAIKQVTEQVEEQKNKINNITRNVNEFIIGKDKVDEIRGLCKETGMDETGILRRFNINSLEELTYLDYRKAMSVLQNTAKKATKKAQ